MDKVNIYKTYIHEVIQEILSPRISSSSPVKTRFVSDEKRGHYLLFHDGWRGEHRVYGCFLHIEVTAQGKVWIHNDGTDIAVAQKLLDKGIPKSDMVIGFHPPVARADTGFALGY
jgi:hypothetical protein